MDPKQLTGIGLHLDKRPHPNLRYTHLNSSMTLCDHFPEEEGDREGTIVKNGRKKFVIHGLVDKAYSHSVYNGSSFRGQEVVFYTERIHDHGNILPAKYNILKYLEQTGFANIPKALFMTSDRRFNYLALERVGKSLHHHLVHRKYTFSLKAVVLMTWKLVNILEFLHSTGVVHGLLSPAEILTSASPRAKEELYLVGFRYAVNFVETPHPTKHLPIMDPIFASPTLYEIGHGTMKGDLESLFFSMVFLLHGSLPWMEKRSRTPFSAPCTDDPLYLEKKKVTPEDLCHEMPNFMAKIYDYVTSLANLEKPCYKWIKHQFKEYLMTL